MQDASASPPSRPNILFALADDASHFGCYGHPWVKTPTIDRLAEQGVLFRNMFCPNPKCAPSRACMLSGKYPWQLEEACNHQCVLPGPEFLKVYPDALESAGYHVGFTGKGWAPGNIDHNGWTRNPAGPAYQERLQAPPEGCAIHPCDYAANFHDFLQQRPDDSPFCFWYGCREPHRPYLSGEGEAQGLTPGEIDEIPPYWPDDAVVRRDLTDYAWEVSWFDEHLRRMVEDLEARGMLDNTLIIVTSDNGCPFPRVKGQMYDDDFRLPFVAHWPHGIQGGREVEDLCAFIDLAPTFYELAGLPRRDDHAGRSLLPLLTSADSGVIDASRNRAFMGREQHDLGRKDDLGYPVRCIRTPQFLLSVNFEPDRWPAGNPETGFTNCDPSPTKDHLITLHQQGESRYFDFAFGKRPRFELFDIRRDPYCMDNLAANPAFAEIRDSLYHELLQLLRQSGDPRLDDPSYFDRMRRHDWERSVHSWKALQEGRWSPHSMG